MPNGRSNIRRETLIVSVAYFAVFFLTFELLIPVQNAFFPAFPSHASLLFLPHGVRVLSAWLLGWRSVIALAPGVFLAFLSIAGTGTFEPSRLLAILIATTIPALVFQTLKLFRWDLSPQPDKRPCWSCVMAAGALISAISSALTNLAFGSAAPDYLAYLIGDFFGLFFLMLILMLIFRAQRWRGVAD